ncbi:hypothetical protein Slin15195_G057020 [Septoria linicola]|uniref:Uncharacterized protein n=1 Tax=Septoria linicola TaxID=215465 RepID=A0A9Q9EKH1_9PEZI|nr:hypothetical protein Slin14017_G072890 [Septoria linicola]USW52383.1 hypothetical protein Slin15195_G057020 [Septoria linicola]
MLPLDYLQLIVAILAMFGYIDNNADLDHYFGAFLGPGATSQDRSLDSELPDAVKSLGTDPASAEEESYANMLQKTCLHVGKSVRELARVCADPDFLIAFYTASGKVSPAQLTLLNKMAPAAVSQVVSVATSGARRIDTAFQAATQASPDIYRLGGFILDTGFPLIQNCLAAGDGASTWTEQYEMLWSCILANLKVGSLGGLMVKTAKGMKNAGLQ